MSDSDRRPVAVSDLVQLTRCEQQLLFDAQFGKRLTAERERLAAEGEAEHARHDALAQRHQGDAAARDRRCFVASALYGESARETDLLRAWRDRVLLPSWWGRGAVCGYYRLSPGLARALAHRPGLRWLVRWLLDRWVRRLGRWGG